MDLSVFNNAVVAEWPINHNGSGPIAALRFKASSIRKERTGVHAALYIGCNESILEWDECNVLRREDRTRLANGAHKLLPPALQSVVTKESLGLALGGFCLKLWDAWTAHERPSYMVGFKDGSPLPFVLEPFIVSGGGTVLFGQPGVGKTYVGLAMAVSVDAGLLSLWRTQRTRVLFINLERSDESLQRRLGAVNAALGLDPGRELLIHNARGRSLSDVREPCERAIKEEDVGLVVLDSLSRAGAGDLTENQPANRAMDILNSMAPAWVALAHSPRGDDSHVFGSQMFDAAADVMVSVMSERREYQIGMAMRITKANDIGPQPMKLIGFQFDQAGLEHIWRPEPHEFPGLIARQPLELEDKIAEVFANEGHMTVEEIAMKMGKDRTTMSTYLNLDPRFEEKGKSGRAKLFGLVDA